MADESKTYTIINSADGRHLSVAEFRTAIASAYDLEALKDTALSLLDGVEKLTSQITKDRARVQRWAVAVQEEFSRKLLAVRDASSRPQSPTVVLNDGAIQLQVAAPPINLAPGAIAIDARVEAQKTGVTVEYGPDGRVTGVRPKPAL
jgi:hypothetical protein